MYIVFCTYKDTNQLLSYQLFPSVSDVSWRSPFHRFDNGEGSRSVAERFVIVIKTKPSPAHLQRSVVTFQIANIVTIVKYYLGILYQVRS